MAEAVSQAKAAGSGQLACIRVRAPLDAEAKAGLQRQVSSMAQGSGDASVKAELPLPSWCANTDHMDGAWWFTRRDACRMTTATYTVVDAQTGALLGSMEYYQVEYANIPTSGLDTGYQITITPFRVKDLGLPTTLAAYGTCTQLCNLSPNPVPKALVLHQGTTVDYRVTATTSAPGARGVAWAEVDVRMYPPGGVGVRSSIEKSLGIRCDNQLIGITGAGCVFGGYEPLFYLDTDQADNPTYWLNALNVNWALYTGLPSKLTRHGDTAKSKQNGDRACPGGDPYIRPPGYECDEYPFRSTEEGAATSGTPFAPRTWNWCQLNWPNTPIVNSYVGPEGWARCNIPEGQNDEGGAALKTFYGNERVLAGDKFNVAAGP
ncbi:hypothetical protein ACIRL2_41230 [Embleya sp. NPDC127516]|uniref:hypothetical protein n=1 Tax=Embleya sp. NPDC127516 TaxID=3363990 RepID=UPI0038237CB1